MRKIAYFGISAVFFAISATLTHGFSLEDNLIPKKLVKKCEGDKQKFCTNVEKVKLLKCLKKHIKQLTSGCKKAVEKSGTNLKRKW